MNSGNNDSKIGSNQPVDIVIKTDPQIDVGDDCDVAFPVVANISTKASLVIAEMAQAGFECDAVMQGMRASESRIVKGSGQPQAVPVWEFIFTGRHVDFENKFGQKWTPMVTVWLGMDVIK